jgi:hypothetical protein
MARRGRGRLWACVVFANNAPATRERATCAAGAHSQANGSNTGKRFFVAAS